MIELERLDLPLCGSFKWLAGQAEEDKTWEGRVLCPSQCSGWPASC
jgi:hypothetical protein